MYLPVSMVTNTTIPSNLSRSIEIKVHQLLMTTSFNNDVQISTGESEIDLSAIE